MRLTHFRRPLVLLLGFTCAWFTPAGHTQPAPHSAEAWTPADAFISARQRIVHSTATGRDYRILVSIPDTPPPSTGYPILYLLDGHVAFPLATLIAREQSERGAVLGFEPGILVGIVHLPIDGDKTPRSDDFTPPAADLSNTGDTTAARQGGAERFFAFIENELKPLLASEFAIDPQRQSLFGHSYGGLFTLHTLFTHPSAFQRYIAASPSIWWNNRLVLGERETFLTQTWPGLRHTNATPRVMVSVGDGEQTPLPHHLKANRGDMLIARRMVDNARELSASLQAANVPCRFFVFENDNHGTARVPAIGQAIRFAFGP